MSFSVIFDGLKKGHHLEMGLQGLTAVRDQKGCCFSRTLTQQTAKERLAIQSATKIITNNLKNFDAPDIETMYAAVNRRYKNISAQTSGIIAWILSLFRSCAHNRELKHLKNDYYAFQQAFPKKFLIDRIAQRHVGKPDLEADKLICKQIKQELPDLFKKGKIKPEDFKNVPFFIRQEKKGYTIIFPPKNGAPSVSKPLNSLCNLKKLVLEQYASDLLKYVKEHMDPLAALLPPSKAMKFTIEIKDSSFILNTDNGNENPYSQEIHPPVSEKIVLQQVERCFMQVPLVPQRTSLPTFLQFYQAHGAAIKHLNLENIKGLTDKNLQHICERCPNLESLTINTETVRQLDLSQMKNLNQVTLFCNNLESLNCSGLDKLTQLSISPTEQLKTLILNGCSSLDLPSLESCKVLEELDLTNCKFGALSFYQSLELQKVILNHAQTVTEINLIDCPKLKTLQANNCPELDLVFLKTLPELTEVGFLRSEKLREVTLDGLTTFGDKFKLNDFYYFNWRQLNIPSIERLTIRNMPIDSISLGENEKLKHLNIAGIPKLRMIEFNKLTIESIELNELPNLKSLELSNNTFTEQSFDSLCTQISKLNSFSSINLIGSNITATMKAKLQLVLKPNQHANY